MNQDNITNENIKIQGLLESYLRFRSSAAKAGSEDGNHLDEDGLAAFVDGNLTRRENESFIAHLVNCSFCLHKTAELTELRSAFEEEVFDAGTQSAEPVKVSEVLSNLFSRLFGSSDGVVFAHEEKKEDQPSTNGSGPPEDESKS
jgi:hypothetical protein